MPNMGSTILTTGLVSIKWAALLKRVPSPKISNIFTHKCTIINEIKKRPERLIITFFPIEVAKRFAIS